jgi:predicted nucleic acid-binding protein
MIRVFLDASVLFAAAYSESGASREIIRLGVQGQVELWASEYVL